MGFRAPGVLLVLESLPYAKQDGLRDADARVPPLVHGLWAFALKDPGLILEQVADEVIRPAPQTNDIGGAVVVFQKGVRGVHRPAPDR